MNSSVRTHRQRSIFDTGHGFVGRRSSDVITCKMALSKHPHYFPSDDYGFWADLGNALEPCDEQKEVCLEVARLPSCSFRFQLELPSDALTV